MYPETEPQGHRDGRDGGGIGRRRRREPFASAARTTWEEAAEERTVPSPRVLLL